MGDRRFESAYRAMAQGASANALAQLDDAQVIEALAHASRESDPYVANVLASEAMNRMRRARLVYEHIGEGVCLLGPRGELRELNPAAREMLAISPEALAAAPSHAILHAPGEETCAVCRVMATGHEETCEMERLRTGDGALLSVSCVVAPVKVDHTIEGFVVAFRDASERAGWIALIEAFYHLHDKLGMGLVITDRTSIHYANDAFRAMVGRSLEDLLELSDLISLADPADHERLREAFRWTGQTVEPSRVRARLQRSDGARVEVDLFVTTTPEEPRLRYVCLVEPVRALTH